MAQPLAALIVRVLSDTTEVVTGMQTVTTKVKETEQAVTKAGGNIAALSSGVDQFDRSLAQVGISLGPLPGALREISAASGQTITQLGLLGTAGLAAAAALGGFQLGRLIADFAGTDEIIGQATASLLGWGNVASEVAATNTNTLAIASKAAGRDITDLAEAIGVLTAEAERNTAAMIAEADAISFVAAAADNRPRRDMKGFHEGVDAANARFGEQEAFRQAQATDIAQIADAWALVEERVKEINAELRKANELETMRLNSIMAINIALGQQAEKNTAAMISKMTGGGGTDAIDQIHADMNEKLSKLKAGGDPTDFGTAQALIWAEANVQIQLAIDSATGVREQVKGAADEAARFAGQIQMAHVTMSGAGRTQAPGESIFTSGKFAASPFIGGQIPGSVPMGAGAGGITNNWNISGVMASDQASFMRQIDQWFSQRMTQGTLRGAAR